MKVFLEGFVQELQTRLFTFKRVADDRSTTKVVIAVDLSLALKYKIPLQDLPGICKGVVESSPVDETADASTLSEGQMSAIRTAALAVASQRQRRGFTTRPRPTPQVLQPQGLNVVIIDLAKAPENAGTAAIARSWRTGH